MFLVSKQTLASTPPMPNPGATSLSQQVVLDLHDCDAPRFAEPQWLKTVLSEIARRADRRALETTIHQMGPWGILIRAQTPASELALHVIAFRRFASLAFLSDSGAIDLERSGAFAISVLAPGKTELRHLYGGRVTL
jgi:S-adenosylmethionine/arginine decarboxylase-like enzyme